MLIDCAKGIAVRVWKGYRDAECSFLQVTQPVNQSKKKTIESDSIRHALFLVIYAPRRLCLEVWAMQRGSKVAVFSVSRGGRLISNPHSTMDSHSITERSKASHKPCLFLDSNGDLKNISVPFYCALSEGSSVTAKDLHLLNRIQAVLKNKAKSEEERLEEITTACGNLQADEIRVKCIEFMVKTSSLQPKLFKETLSIFVDVHQPQSVSHSNALDSSGSEQSSVRQQMQQMARNYIGLTDFYLYLTDMISGSNRLNDPVVQLNLSHIELENVQKLVDIRCVEKGTNRSTRVVTFDESAGLPRFIDYLSIFDCCPSTENQSAFDPEHHDKSEEPEDDCQPKIDVGMVTLKESKAKRFGVVGRQMFYQLLERGKSFSDFVEFARNSRISSIDLMRLFMLYWLDRPFKCTDRFVMWILWLWLHI